MIWWATSPQINIVIYLIQLRFHQPGFLWNSRGFPFTNSYLFGGPGRLRYPGIPLFLHFSWMVSFSSSPPRFTHDCPQKNLFQKQVQVRFTSFSLHQTSSCWYIWVGPSCWRQNKMPMFATTLANPAVEFTLCPLTTPPLMTLMSHSVSSLICSGCDKWHRDTPLSN